MKAPLLRAWYAEAIHMLERREHELLAQVLATTELPVNEIPLEALEALTLCIMAIEAFKTRINLLTEAKGE